MFHDRGARVRQIRPTQLLLSVFCALSLLTSHAQPSGAPSLGAASADELSPVVERKLGEAIMVEGRRDPDFIDDPAINQYLNDVAHRLVAFAPPGGPELEVFGVRDPVINAFAMPGGFIGVNSGLVVSTKSEAELAGVLAHETAHVVQRHMARGLTQQKQSNTIALASIAAAVLAALAHAGGNAAAGIALFGQAAALDQQLGFSREAEQEADRICFDMLIQAGYDPNGMVRMFAGMMNAASLNESVRGGVFASTHPLSIQRMTDMQNRVRLMKPVPNQSSSDYWYVRAKMRVIQSSDAKVAILANEQFQEEVRTGGGASRSAAQLGLSLFALQRKNYSMAEQYLLAAQTNTVASAFLSAQRIDIDLAKGDVTSALNTAQAAVKKWPDQLALVKRLVKSYEVSKRDRELVDLLAQYIQRWPKQVPWLYESLGKAQGRLGLPIASRENLANYYRLTGALAAAVNQLQEARTLSSDFYEQSQIDVNVQKIREQMTEERRMLERFKS